MKFLVTGGTGFIGARVVANLWERKIPVIAADLNLNIEWTKEVAILKHQKDSSKLAEIQQQIEQTLFIKLDVSDKEQVKKVFEEFPDITHVIHLAYLMSAEVEADQHRGVSVNMLGMINMFDMGVQHNLSRIVFASSETIYGANHSAYGDENYAVKEQDYCSLDDHFYTYGVMKMLNEFTAQKYVKNKGVSIAAMRPPIVYGDGRMRGSVLWACEFATNPALGKKVKLPFSKESRDCWIYVDDAAEQFVRLALKPTLNHFAYNNGGHSVTAHELMQTVAHIIPDAQYEFDESVPRTSLVDRCDSSRLEEEIDFTPRSLEEGIRAQIEEARSRQKLTNY
ncbi:NAD-dependent epimerase/dehydratase family protein [Flavobacterium foetidum]|uniref:NAD-dependent epimerase/dehydratase family protein n=1 Tax=Flavobacterium foetidum TaxID=2026681 RepID=UPI0010752032|nr:NAD(P)-dependent oxidoreductase [Flavobacterium foetidum]KAF2514867.1 NAD(P)-dependent oxidoreductase [Flavobacterium foetidum]